MALTSGPPNSPRLIHERAVLLRDVHPMLARVQGSPPRERSIFVSAINRQQRPSSAFLPSPTRMEPVMSRDPLVWSWPACALALISPLTDLERIPDFLGRRGGSNDHLCSKGPGRCGEGSGGGLTFAPRDALARGRRRPERNRSRRLRQPDAGSGGAAEIRPHLVPRSTQVRRVGRDLLVHQLAWTHRAQQGSELNRSQ